MVNITEVGRPPLDMKEVPLPQTGSEERGGGEEGSSSQAPDYRLDPATAGSAGVVLLPLTFLLTVPASNIL